MTPVLVLVGWGCCNQGPQTGDFRETFLQIQRLEVSDVSAISNSFLVMWLLDGHFLAVSLRGLCVWREREEGRKERKSTVVYPCKEAICWMGSSPSQPHLTIITCSEAPSENAVTFGVGFSTYEFWRE